MNAQTNTRLENISEENNNLIQSRYYLQEFYDKLQIKKKD